MALSKLVVGASPQNPDMVWATQFCSPDPFALLVLNDNDRRVMVVNPLEYNRALKEAMAGEVVCSSQKLSEAILSLLESFNISSVLVPEDFPASLYSYFLGKGVGVSISDSLKPLFPERAVKKDYEIEDISYAQLAIEKAFKKLLDIIERANVRDGKLWNGKKYLTSEDLRKIFELEVLKQNCLSEATIVASGDQAANPHCLGSGPILANTPIVIDMFTRSRKKWYWSDMTRTVVKGFFSNPARRLYEAVFEAQERALEMVRPGIDGWDIHNFVSSFFKEEGFKTEQVNGVWRGFFHGTGHGVGVEIHEWPRVSGRYKNQILQPGNVITIEPGLYYPGIGGVRIEDTVVVTENGYRNLAKPTKELIELP
ncbi:MAG: aminopeptidase P family protein [Candidatus Nealsonbacteria bacterium]|nr:aminopeptidase P family protein [Candidatus Nealsonbacteria bacterium]